MEIIKEIANNFQLDGYVVDVKKQDNGLINQTYVVTTSTHKKYIIQKINTFVFENPYQIMENIKIIVEHLERKKTNKQTLKIIKTLDGKCIYNYGGGFYRCYNYIVNSISYQVPTNYKILSEAGKCIGDFQANLIDLDVSKIKNVFCNFHNTPFRFDLLRASYHKVSGKRRDIGCKLYAKIKDENRKFSIIERNIEKGNIPKRITHNDTKLNNIMFDETTNKALCMIDLDTVMEGSVLYDFGDALRIAASAVSEDEKDVSKINFDTKAYCYFLIGYLSKMCKYLNTEEKKHLVDSIYVITMECSIRFLTDYFDGDVYFETKYENHNLDRAINQYYLAQNIKSKEPVLLKLTKSLLNHFEKYC